MFKRVAFTMYPVVDMDRARNFYENVLGLPLSNVFADGKWVEYDLEQGGCFAITNMVQDYHTSSTSGGSIAFEVEDVDKLVAELKEKGVEFKVDLFDSPVCRMAVALDSEGNAFMLHQLHRKN